MKSFKSFITEEEKVQRGKNISVGKNNVKISPDSEELKEETPVERIDRISREKVAARKAAADAAAANKASSTAAFQAHKKEVLAKGGRPVDALDSWQKKKMNKEGYAPGDVDQKVGAVTAIPQSERDAAKARLLAKTAAKRKEREMAKEEFEIEEGMTMKDFKANRRKLKRKEASTDAKKRGHVGKEWYNSGRTYSPDEAKSGRAKMDDEERSTRKRSAIDPDAEDSDYSADKTKNPKKLRKQKAMGEAMSFSDFMEARRMDKEGVDRGDSRRAERAEKAKASLAAVKKGEERKQKVSKKYGIEPSKADTVEKRAHKRDFAGSRQAPKQKGAKETDLQTHNRRVNAANKRRMTHGWTSKEKAANRGMENAGSRFD